MIIIKRKTFETFFLLLQPELKLVTSENRPKALTLLYEKAAVLDSPPPVNRPDSLVMLMANGGVGGQGGANYLDAADYGRASSTICRRPSDRTTDAQSTTTTTKIPPIFRTGIKFRLLQLF